jgi:hypothetical protein
VGCLPQIGQRDVSLIGYRLELYIGDFVALVQ